MKLCHVPVPCNNCPFRRVGGIRLVAERLEEIASCVAPEDGQGATFACHKTTGASGGPRTQELQCAGGIIFGYKQGTSSNFIRIMERLNMVDPSLCDDEHPYIFDSIEEMLETALERGTTTKRKRKRGCDGTIR